MLGSRPICWSRKEQASLAPSSTKAEYRGDVNVDIQAVWIHGILIKFGIHTSPSVDLFFYNHSAIKISSDPV